MSTNLLALFEGADPFMPHSFCFLWNQKLIWLHAISDGLVAVAYLSIPLILLHFVRKRRDVPFSWMFACFGMFILACGSTHIMDVVTLWIPAYWLSGILKAVTAVVSVVTAVFLIRIIPEALALPRPQELARSNIALQAEIEDRRRAEESVHKLNQRLAQHAAELSVSNQDLHSFTYSVSHDLRAPLRHIAGFSRILLDDFGPDLASEARHHLQRIDEGTRHMGELVDSLLNLAHLGQRPLALQATNLNTVVRNVRLVLETETLGRSVEWKIGNLPTVDCDPTLMRDVFQNLVSNALKYSRSRSPALIEIGQTERDGQPVFFVKDNGVGFSMKYADKLFGVCQRLHRPEDFEGTGVGLATVQRIIQKHEGRVWAESEVDCGATFYFTLRGHSQAYSQASATTVGGES